LTRFAKLMNLSGSADGVAATMQRCQIVFAWSFVSEAFMFLDLDLDLVLCPACAVPAALAG
jgi:hypothetical protein